METPLISVLMPVFNGEKFLSQAIESILTQTYKNFEFIIINDGSSDDTEKIILSYSDPRIRYVKNERNLRLIKTLNLGIDLALGDYIARMDADDVSMKYRLEEQIKCFKENKKIDFVNSQCFFLSEDGECWKKNRSNFQVGSEAIKIASIFQTMIIHPAVMIKASVLKDFRYFDDETVTHIEDFDLWNRLFERGKECFTIPKSLINYRINQYSITSTNNKQQQQRLRQRTIFILKDRFDAVVDNNVLSLIQGDFYLCSFKLLKKMDLFFCYFFNDLHGRELISKDAFSELVMWKKHRIFLTVYKSFSKVNLLDKIGIIYFLTTKISWVRNLNRLFNHN